ncbi:MAG TPA: alpha/beta hydrolase-fold protein [Gemmatimonadales bacterium]|nr:alpha/beta hydrolase-fold protein [Gemmatimonadales bacterium]
MRIGMIAVVVTAFSWPCRTASATHPAQGERSPRIERLRQEAARRGPSAVQDFWSAVGRTGTPLIEAVPRDTETVLATFVYRGMASTTGVTLSAQLRAGGAPGENALERLGATNVWFRSYRIRKDLRFSYGFVEQSRSSGSATGVARDPLNPHVLSNGEGLLGPSVVVLPAAAPQPWTEPREGVARGTMHSLRVHSVVLGQDREAQIYTPAGYDERRTTPYHLLLCFDGGWFASATSLPTILDNLIAARAIPPLVGIFVEQSPQPQRNLELGNDDRFLSFLTTELLPTVRRRWNATADPHATAACGGSSGGLASLFAAYRRPDVIGNVISESGAFWVGHRQGDGKWEWLTHQIAGSAALPIHVVLDVGILESGATDGGGPSILATNRHLRDVLTTKGTDLDYREVAGGHEPLSWRGGIADGLISLFGSGSIRRATRW